MLDRMLGPQPGGPRRVAAGAARGAQYSPDRGLVNARVWGVSGAQPRLAGARTGVSIRGRRSGFAPGRAVQGFSSSLSLAKRRDPTWKTCSAPAPRVRARSVTRAPSIFTAPSSILRLASQGLAGKPASLTRFLHPTDLPRPR